ncbi:hypothetical protein GO755_33505 [Spirosoma sp. HMF4905]|uniref:Uncharacterized protein n=1 Tax=Spirosoma arboris TaxID=2682092 RepID=A0A7K1SMU9_9BACT|nr:hypothetical protein [Spirosoma arboris]MVM34993.1 hypothetical protein [Spirosoma arboris]
MNSEISFVLVNPSDGDVMAILIPAMLRRAKLLKGKFLAEESFKDEASKVDIQVSEIVPAGALEEFDEYLSQLENIQIVAIEVDSDSLAQATMNFVQKTYVEFKPATVTNIETVATLVPGKSAVLHTFSEPFKSGQMNSLEMKLLAGQRVKLTLKVAMPGSATSTLPPLS